jgi:hypothetical protein
LIRNSIAITSFCFHSVIYAQWLNFKRTAQAAHMRKEQSRQKELWAYKLVRERMRRKIECVNGLAFPLWDFSNSRKQQQKNSRRKISIIFHPLDKFDYDANYQIVLWCFFSIYAIAHSNNLQNRKNSLTFVIRRSQMQPSNVESEQDNICNFFTLRMCVRV